MALLKREKPYEMGIEENFESEFEENPERESEETKAPLSYDGDYDLTQVYDEAIVPHLDAIKKICVKHHMPYAFMFATKNGKDNTLYKKYPDEPDVVGAKIRTDGLMSGSMGRKLIDDRFNSFLLLIRGGKFIPPAKDIEDEYLFNKIADQLQDLDDDDEGMDMPETNDIGKNENTGEARKTGEAVGKEACKHPREDSSKGIQRQKDRKNG